MAKLERWLPMALLGIAVGIGLILYFQGGNPLDHLKVLSGYVALILVFGIGLLILAQIAIGKIDLKYLIAETDGHASMSRLQLLIFTFVIALSIVMMVVSRTPPSFPAIPNEVLILLGISASTYAVAKGIQKGGESEPAAPPPPQPQPPEQPERARGAAAGGGAEG